MIAKVREKTFILFFMLSSSFLRANNDLQIKGVLSIDQIHAIEDSANASNRIANGANLNAAQVSFDKGLTNSIHLHLDFSFSKDGKARLGTAFIEKTLFEGLSFKAGQIPSPFSLEASESSKWLVFPSKSLAVSAFSPGIGPGLSVNYWTSTFGLKLAVRQPSFDYYSQYKEDDENYNDRLAFIARFNVSPINTEEQTLHMSSSYTYQNIAKDLSFSTEPEFKTRDKNQFIGTDKIEADSLEIWGVEFAYLWNQFQMEAEYMAAVAEKSEKKYSYSGWHTQVNYTLTGQRRLYSTDDGVFSNPDIKGNEQAVQIGIRYSHLDLNSTHSSTKDSDSANGGEETNISFAINWYIKKSLKLTGAYIKVDATKQNETRKPDVLLLRMQTTF